MRALFLARKSQETRSVLLMKRWSRVCFHFWPISGHFHSNPNLVDLPMMPLTEANECFGQKCTRVRFFWLG
jgi:hypothetical protein